MDWNQIYKDKHSKLKGWSFSYVINARQHRFKSNAPTKEIHLLELEYLILNYDYSKTLFRRYESLLSEEIKSQWIEQKSRIGERFSNANYNIYGVLIPFYLANPKTENSKIDKHFLNDQILLTLGGLDHKFRKYRWRANYVLELLPQKFSQLKPNLRIRIIDLLAVKANQENIRGINLLIFKNIESVNRECIETFVREQIDKDLITSKMAIGYYKQFEALSQYSASKLKVKILSHKNGEMIFSKIKTGS